MLKKHSFFLLILLGLFSLSGYTQEEDDLIDELEADRKRQTEAQVKLDQSRQKIQESAFNAIVELKKLGHENVTAASLLDEKVVKVLQRMFRESHLKHLPQEEIRKLLFEKAKGSYLESVLSKSPKLTDALVAVLQDDKAMPGLVGIFLKQEDLKLYFFIWLGVMIAGYFLKRFFLPTSWRESFIFSMLFSFMLTTINLTIFYQMFYTELSPTVRILSDHWGRA